MRTFKSTESEHSGGVMLPKQLTLTGRAEPHGKDIT